MRGASNVDLTLPPFDQERVRGAGLVRRAATAMLVVFATAVAISLVLGSQITIGVTVDGQGVLEPLSIVPVRSMQQGLIARVLVGNGDTVAANQPLIVMDSLAAATELLSLEAQLAAALLTHQQLRLEAPADRGRQVAQRAQADAHVGRAIANLRDRMVIHGLGKNVDSLLRFYVPGTLVNIDLALSDVRSAQAEQLLADAEERVLGLAGLSLQAESLKVDQLQVNLSAARTRLNRLTIRAPADGVVLTDQLDRLIGSNVNAGDQLLEIGSLNLWRAVVFVRESDMAKVRTGDSVSVEVPALSELRIPRLSGVVESIAATPSSAASQGTLAGPGLYRIVISLDPRQLSAIGIQQFRRGYSVAGRIVTQRGVILRLIYDRIREQLRRHTALLR